MELDCTDLTLGELIGEAMAEDMAEEIAEDLSSGIEVILGSRLEVGGPRMSICDDIVDTEVDAWESEDLLLRWFRSRLSTAGEYCSLVTESRSE